MAKYNDSVKLIIKCNRAAADSMIPLLKELKYMGRAGCSRGIEIKEYDGEHSFGFDGDGPDRIDSIELDGELVKSNIEEDGMRVLRKGAAGTRGVPDGSGPDGKGPTGLRLGGCPKREDFDDEAEYKKAMLRWKEKNQPVKKSHTEGKMNRLRKSGLTLVVIPGELSKAAKLSAVGSSHPAGLSGVSGKTKSKIPYTGHVERMKLAKMAAERMMAPKPEDEGKYADTPIVDHKGREKGEKPPYFKYSTGVSGMGSQAHGNFGRATLIVKPSEIGTSTPEGSTAHTPISNVSKPRK
jgi:hypothetical protein